MNMWIWNEVVVVVDNVIEMRWYLCCEWHGNTICWLMLEMHWHVHVVYVRGATVHWPFRVFGTSFWPRSYVGCCVWSWGALCTDLPGSLALAFGHDHTSYEVYVMGGRVHWPCRMAQMMEACLWSFYGGWIFELQWGPLMVVFPLGVAGEDKGKGVGGGAIHKGISHERRSFTTKMSLG